MRGKYLARCISNRVCDHVPIALLGTEVGPPMSNGRVAVVLEGSVVADGSGYEFTDGLLVVDTKPGCVIGEHTTLTISGQGPVPELSLYTMPGNSRYFVGILSGSLYAAYRNPGSVVASPFWAIQNAPVIVAPGVNYTLVIVVGATYVRAWLNGASIGRQTIYPNYLGTSAWQLRVGDYFDSPTPTTYTGRLSSITWEVGALYPDVDNI